MQISVVIPLYNEAESLPELMAWIHRVMDANSYSFEVIMIDDGSDDGSWDVITNLRNQFPQLKGIRFQRNYGKSAALNEGFKAAQGDVVITMDADLQDSPDEIPGLRKMIVEDGYDLVSGWKKKRYDSVVAKNLPSKLFNWAARKTSGVELNDFNCGLKAYKNIVVKNIEVSGEMHRYIPVLAKNAGFGKIGENPANETGTSSGNDGAWSSQFPYSTGLGVLLTKDHSLIRKPGILKGQTANPSFFDPLLEWDSIPPVVVRLDSNGNIVYGTSGNPILDGNWSSLGSHECNCNNIGLNATPKTSPSVYPNPSNGVVFVRTQNDIRKIQVVSALGQELWSKYWIGALPLLVLAMGPMLGLPIRSFIGATEPLGRFPQVLKGSEAVADSRFVVRYFRKSRDGRLLFGGRVSYSGIDARDTGGATGARMRRGFPQQAGTRRIPMPAPRRPPAPPPGNPCPGSLCPVRLAARPSCRPTAH